MSGKKRVTIANAEYERLRAQAERLRTIEYDLPEHIAARMRQASAELQNSLAPLEQRQRSFEQMLSGLSSEVRDFERESARRLEQHQHQTRQALDDLSHRFEEGLTNLEQDLRATEVRLQEEIYEAEMRQAAAIAEERRQRQQAIQNMQGQINNIHADQQRKAALAETWLQNARKLIDFIESNYRHQQFAPGRMERLCRDVEQAAQNLAQNTPEAALSQAQNAYHALSDLRLELEQSEHEWHIWHNAALEEAKRVLTEARRNRRCQAVDMEGKTLEGVDLLEVDWWTDGKWSALEKEVQEVIDRVKSPRPVLSTDELRRLAQQEVPNYSQRLLDLIAEARMAVLSSQMRISIADLVVQALEDLGYQLEDGVYEANDMRNGYLAKLNFPDGGEVVVEVAPDQHNPAQNEMTIHSYDQERRSEYELRQRAREVASSLRQQGLEVPADMQDTGERANPETRDLQQVKKRQTKHSVK